MNYTMEDLNGNKVVDLLRIIWEGNHRFKDINSELSWSKATVSKYLQTLQKNNFIEKDLTSGGNVGYFFTEKGEAVYENQNLFETIRNGFSNERVINRARDQNNYLQELLDLGLFDEGLDIQDISDISLPNSEESLIESEGEKVTVEDFRKFVLVIKRMFEPKMSNQEIEGKIRIDSEDPQKLKRNIIELEDSMEQLDFP